MASLIRKVRWKFQKMIRNYRLHLFFPRDNLVVVLDLATSGRPRVLTSHCGAMNHLFSSSVEFRCVLEFLLKCCNAFKVLAFHEVQSFFGIKLAILEPLNIICIHFVRVARVCPNQVQECEIAPTRLKRVSRIFFHKFFSVLFELWTVNDGLQFP